MEKEIVWLHEYRCFGLLIIRNATHSLITFITENGWETEWIENDDYDLWEERAFDYDTDDGQ